MSNPRSLAQEAVSWYLSHVDEYAPHADNVRLFFRGPVISLTVSILKGKDVENEKEKVTVGGANWKDYLSNKKTATFSPLMEQDPKEFEALSPRANARLEAFLLGVSLALPSEETTREPAPETPKKACKKQVQLGEFAASNCNQSGLSPTEQGLSGFCALDILPPSASPSRMCRMSISSTNSVVKQPQISKNDLVTRLKLYLRNSHRAKALGQECRVAVEPMQAIKAQAARERLDEWKHHRRDFDCFIGDGDFNITGLEPDEIGEIGYYDVGAIKIKKQ
jgi:hypothetical protein